MNSTKVLENSFNKIINDIENKEFKYSSRNIKEIITLGYFSKILESTRAVIILLKEDNMQSAIMPIVRNMLEAVIDLDNIVNVEGYVEYLLYINLNNKYILGKKEYLKNIYKYDDFEDTCNNIRKGKRQFEQELKRKYKNVFLKKQGNQRIIDTSIKFKFELSKSKDTYDSLYWLLCNDTHNNISSIEAYYIDNINQDFVVNPFKKNDEKNIDNIIFTVESILNDSVTFTRQMLGS